MSFQVPPPQGPSGRGSTSSVISFYNIHTLLFMAQQHTNLPDLVSWIAHNPPAMISSITLEGNRIRYQQASRIDAGDTVHVIQEDIKDFLNRYYNPAAYGVPQDVQNWFYGSRTPALVDSNLFILKRETLLFLALDRSLWGQIYQAISSEDDTRLGSNILLGIYNESTGRVSFATGFIVTQNGLDCSGYEKSALLPDFIYCFFGSRDRQGDPAEDTCDTMPSPATIENLGNLSEALQKQVQIFAAARRGFGSPLEGIHFPTARELFAASQKPEQHGWLLNGFQQYPPFGYTVESIGDGVVKGYSLITRDIEDTYVPRSFKIPVGEFIDRFYNPEKQLGFNHAVAEWFYGSRNETLDFFCQERHIDVLKQETLLFLAIDRRLNRQIYTYIQQQIMGEHVSLQEGAPLLARLDDSNGYVHCAFPSSLVRSETGIYADSVSQMPLATYLKQYWPAHIPVHVSDTLAVVESSACVRRGPSASGASLLTMGIRRVDVPDYSHETMLARPEDIASLLPGSSAKDLIAHAGDNLWRPLNWSQIYDGEKWVRGEGLMRVDQNGRYVLQLPTNNDVYVLGRKEEENAWDNDAVIQQHIIDMQRYASPARRLVIVPMAETDRHHPVISRLHMRLWRETYEGHVRWLVQPLLGDVSITSQDGRIIEEALHARNKGTFVMRGRNLILGISSRAERAAIGFGVY